MAKCRICGNESDGLINGLCPNCLALASEQAALVDDDDPAANVYMNEHEGEAPITMDTLKHAAMLGAAGYFNRKAKAKDEEEERISGVLNQAGIMDSEGQRIFHDDAKELLKKHGAKIDSGEYRVCKADIMDRIPNGEVVDSSRGLVVYTMKRAK